MGPCGIRGERLETRSPGRGSGEGEAEATAGAVTSL